MRLLSGDERPTRARAREGHQVVMQYFAQDEATRLDPALTVYETLAAGSPNDMVPMIRNILGGFLFSGDDVYKKAGVLSGGERTRLAVARMLLRPSNTLLLDEPTNHLDLDSKDVLLEALEDYGGTLIFVSHDRYFVEKLATKIIEIGHGRRSSIRAPTRSSSGAKAQRAGQRAKAQPPTPRGLQKSDRNPEGPRKPAEDREDRGQALSLSCPEERKRAEAEKKKPRGEEALQKRIADLEARIADQRPR